MTGPSFPPLLNGLAVTGATDPFDKACAQALLGCEAGLVVYNLSANNLRAALVLAPEVPLEDAVAMLPLCGVGFQNALGALAPPEVAVHLDWEGGIFVNGAVCGKLRMAASHADPAVRPDWIVVGIEIPLWPETDQPGENPGETALYAEGCADVDATALLESWARHSLVGINRWQDDGAGPLHKEWRGLARNIGETVQIQGKAGTFVGVDERFGLLLRDGETTTLIPTTTLLENAS